MGLSERAGVSVFQVIFYAPIIFLGFVVAARHGFRQNLAWLFLSGFATVRVIGSIMFVVASQQAKSSNGLLIASYVMQGLGLSPLLLATSGFLGIIVYKASLSIPARIPVLGRLSLVVAAGLSVKAGIDTKPNDVKSATFKKIAATVLLVIYVVLVLEHGYLWMNVARILRSRRVLLIAISCALPFLAARIAFSMAGAYEASFTGPFNPSNGNETIFIVMNVLMECITVLIYIIAGLRLPLSTEADAITPHEEHYSNNGRSGGDYPMPQYGNRG